MAMVSLLKRMSYSGITVHGFRSTFRDWVAECTDYPDSLAEEALAHIIMSQTVAAYRRRDQLEEPVRIFVGEAVERHVIRAPT